MSAHVLRTLTAVVGAAALAAAGLALPGTSAASGTYTSHFSYSAPVAVADSTTVAGSQGIAIPDWGMGTPYPSVITVADRPGVISHVQVVINSLEHPNADDLDVMLLSPAGGKIMLLSDAGDGASDLPMPLPKG